VPETIGLPFVLPFLPEGRIVPVADRGEFFVRVHRHEDPSAPTLALFHGWTASADLQFFTIYPALAERYSLVAIDHRGHGRGLRILDPFLLEDAADDMAAVLAELGIHKVTTLGYSMGGPISMLFTRRHRDLVEALVLEATALEWSASLRERLTWIGLPILGSVLRSWAFPRYLRRAIARVIPVGHELEPYLPWILGEMQRGSSQAIVEAGRCISRYDARDWAPDLRVPAAVLVTTRDRLVPPRKQRRLAAALDATVREIPADHLCTMAQPADYVAATLELLDEVHRATSTSVSL
jgi:3-oxoadipate enol-lactonase